ncbi:AarF/ABC1/UbiB kinase family protein [bacterium]|nr:AarF/ABC1/UbiB kinase family protein [bacterium]
MYLPRPLRRIRNLWRIAKIGEVAVKHGFGYLAERIGGRRYRREEIKEDERYTSEGARLRAFLEELGSTFIKLGQLASTRVDIFPPGIIDELKKLQDSVPPAPFEQIKLVVERELSKPIDEIFLEFHEEPIASASIAQVHEAKLKNNEEVVVKVQRPGVEKRVLYDLELLLDITSLAENRLPAARRLGVHEIAEELARAMRDELNFLIEAENADRLRRALSNETNVYIPKIYWDLSTPYVLTMEKIKGTKINDYIKGLEDRNQRKKLAQQLAELFFKQIVIYGVFHADPHPGNIFILPDGRFALTDFGLVGTLNKTLKSQLLRLSQGLVNQDVDTIVEILYIIGIVPDDVESSMLSAEIEGLFSRYSYIPPSKIKISDLYYAVSEITRKYRIRMPQSFALLGRCMAELEGLCLELDPEFDPRKVLEPLTRRFFADQVKPTNLLKGTVRLLQENTSLLLELPKQLSQVLNKAERGALKLRFEYDRIDRPLLRLNIIANRLSFSIIVAAILVASSLVMQTNIGPYLWGFPAFGIVGYILAGIMGFWLLLSIIRSGRL